MSRADRFAASPTLRSLATRNFRLFFVGQLVSQAGTWMQAVALTWAALDLGGGGLTLGAVTALQFGPGLLLSPYGGVLIDRFDTRRLMIGTQLAFVAVAVALTAASFSGVLGMPALYALALAFGIVNALDSPLRRVIVSELVPPGDVVNAIGLNTTLMTASRVFGPALAGGLIAVGGVGWCFLVNALSYPAVLAGLLLMRTGELWPAPRAAREPRQLRTGLRYLAASPGLRAPLAVMTIVAVFGYQMEVTLPLLAEDTFGAGASGFTLLYAAMSAGAAAGGLVLARRNASSLRMVVAGAWLFAAALLALAAAPHLLVAVLVAVPAGLGSITVLSGAATVVQVHADPQRRGLTVAIVSMIFLGSRPVGGPVAGAIADHWGPRAALAVAGVLCGVAAVLGLVMERHRAARPASTQASPEEPAAAAA